MAKFALIGGVAAMFQAIGEDKSAVAKVVEKAPVKEQVVKLVGNGLSHAKAAAADFGKRHERFFGPWAAGFGKPHERFFGPRAAAQADTAVKYAGRAVRPLLAMDQLNLDFLPKAANGKKTATAADKAVEDVEQMALKEAAIPASVAKAAVAKAAVEKGAEALQEVVTKVMTEPVNDVKKDVKKVSPEAVQKVVLEVVKEPVNDVKMVKKVSPEALQEVVSEVVTKPVNDVKKVSPAASAEVVPEVVKEPVVKYMKEEVKAVEQAASTAVKEAKEEVKAASTAVKEAVKYVKGEVKAVEKKVLGLLGLPQDFSKGAAAKVDAEALAKFMTQLSFTGSRYD